MPSASPQIPISPSHSSSHFGFDTVAERPHAASSASTSSIPAFDVLWEKIEGHRKTSAKPIYFERSMVAPNHTGVRCPYNDHSLTVRLRKNDNTRTPLHANYVRISQSGRYAVGQSPDGDFKLACTRDLIHSLDSGQGLFQFTSRTAHCIGEGSGSSSRTIQNEKSLSTIASMLIAERQKSDDWPKLGERYQVTAFHRLPVDQSQKDVTRYELTATDLETGKPNTVVITQAGLRFVDKLLRPKEIKRAAELFNAHPGSNSATHASDDHLQTGPLICSAAGIGRSAVLAVYQDLCIRMPTDVNEANLDTHLEAAIKKGIETRGPKFLYSKRQVEALREALVANMREAHGAPFENQSARHNVLNDLRQRTAEQRTSSPAERNDAKGVGHSPKTDSIPAIDVSNVESESAPPSRSGHTGQARSAVEQNEVRDTITPSASPRISVVSENNDPAAPRPASQQQVDDRAAAAATTGHTNTGHTNTPVEQAPPAENSAGNIAASTTTGQVRTDQAALGNTESDEGKHVTFGPSPIGTNRRPRPNSYIARHPIELYNVYRDTLQKWDENGHESITFPAQAIELESSIREDPDSLPVVSTAALAVATVRRYLRDSATSLKDVYFDFANDAQKQVYRNLLGRVDTLTPHRMFQALLRPFIEHPVQSTPPAYFFEKKKLAIFVPPKINDEVDNCDEINEAPAELCRDLSGVKFDAWDGAPTTVEEWNNDTNLIEEPALTDNCRAAAAVIVEKDGRAWVVVPTNQRGNKNITFPTGRIRNNSGLSAQACVRKKAYEKTGLQIDLTRHLIDIDMGFGTTRFYIAKRIGGTPADAGWKSEAVCLVPIKELRVMFEDDDVCTHASERYVLEQLQQSTLFAKLSRDAALARSRENLRTWVYHLASIFPRKPDHLDNPISFDAITLKTVGLQLSERLSRLVDHWRENNYQLFEPIGARPGSKPINAATSLETPSGSVVPYLHANHIQADGCRIAFIAAQRPQTGAAQADKITTAQKIRRFLPSLPMKDSRPPQTEVIERPDNRITFWQTVLHQNVDVIVDLDDAQAKSKEAHYGPAENFPLEIGARALVLTNRKQYGKAHVEEIAAFDSEGTQRETVTRLHYTGWPEGGSITATELVDLARRVVLATGGRRAKVLVHSTHGAGRAGTLITFIAASEKIANLLLGPHRMRPERVIDIVMNLVVRGRAERGQGFVDETHIPLLFEALLKEHFVGVSSTGVAYEGDLIGRAL